MEASVKKFEVTFLGRNRNEKGPKRQITAVCISANCLDAVHDVMRRFDVWLVKNVVDVP